MIGCEVSSCFLVSMLFPELLEPTREWSAARKYDTNRNYQCHVSRPGRALSTD